MPSVHDESGRVSADRLTDRISIGVLSRVIPADVIDEVLAETGRAEKRVRLLPAHVVVYFVVAMVIFRDGYEEVMRRLVGGLKLMHSWRDGWQVPSTSAITQARARLGEAPLRELYERIAAPLATPATTGAWLGSWRLMAIDGVQIDVPDTPENVDEFGLAQGGTRRPFPQVRVVGLGECGTHAVIAASIGGLHSGERELAKGVLSFVESNMLLIADRGFHSFEFWAECLTTGAGLLFRVPAGLKLAVEEVLPDGSYLSTISSKRTRGARYRIPLSSVDDPRKATHIPVRVVEYAVETPGADESETYRLISSILDPGEATAIELAAAYHERWEYEISLKEIETQILAPGSGLRSKSPDMVKQELWALLLAHYAIRAVMTEAADSVGLDPDRLSFIRTVNVVRRQITDQAAFSPRTTQSGDGSNDCRGT